MAENTSERIMALQERAVPILDASVLSGLPTKVLLSRLRRLLRCEEAPELSDASPDEIAETSGILFKNTVEWRLAHEQLKVVLASREHVPKSAQRRTARAQGAAIARTVERRRRR